MGQLASRPRWLHRIMCSSNMIGRRAPNDYRSYLDTTDSLTVLNLVQFGSVNRIHTFDRFHARGHLLGYRGDRQSRKIENRLGTFRYNPEALKRSRKSLSNYSHLLSCSDHNEESTP